MPPTISRTSYLEINSVPLATPAWRILDLTPLYGLVMRGSSEPMPYAAGAIGYQHRVDYRSVTLPMDVYGRYQSDGTVNANVYAGLDVNIDYLLANVVTPSTSTYAAVWHRASGTKTANVFVESFEPTRWGAGFVRFGLELSIPSGRFA